MELVISGITGKKEKKAYLSFTENDKTAEISIPDCKVIANNGFTQEELEQLVYYVVKNKEDFWERAKKLNPMKAFLKNKEI